MKLNNEKKIKFSDNLYQAICQDAVRSRMIINPVIDPELIWEGEVDEKL